MKYGLSCRAYAAFCGYEESLSEESTVRTGYTGVTEIGYGGGLSGVCTSCLAVTSSLPVGTVLTYPGNYSLTGEQQPIFVDGVPQSFHRPNGPAHRELIDITYRFIIKKARFTRGGGG